MTARKQLWKTTYLDPNEPTRFTLASFAQYHNLPGPDRPENILSLTKILISRGFADRGDYWSKKQIYKPRREAPLPKVNIPSYVKIPRGVFTSLDLLAVNNMPRYRENVVWARKFLEKSDKVERLPRSWRFVAKNRRNGELPATVTGNWKIPPTPAFTTVQFQKHNSVWQMCITAEQWATAVAFLAHHGFIYDPSWKRWKRQ